MPAIVLLHGFGNNASVFAAQLTLAKAAPRAGYVLILPEGVQDRGAGSTCGDDLPSGCRSWNAGTCCGRAAYTQVDDVAFIRAVVADATKRFRIDRAQVFVSGASNGGSMAIRAGCELGSDVFAGVAADVGSFEAARGDDCGSECYRSGTLPGGNPDDGYVYCAWDQHRDGCRIQDWQQSLPKIYSCQRRKGAPPIPMMLFNGKLDPFSSPMIPGTPNNSGLVSYPADPGVPGSFNESFVPLSYATTHLAEVNGCDLARPSAISFSNGTAGNHTVCRTFSGCAANVTYCISDAGHAWFGDFFSRAYSRAVCEWEFRRDQWGTYCFAPPPPGPPAPGNTYSINETAETLSFFRATAAQH